MIPPPGLSLSKAASSILISSASKSSEEVKLTLPSMVSPKLKLSLPVFTEMAALGALNDFKRGRFHPPESYRARRVVISCYLIINIHFEF